jgi:hypothetical protein
MRLIKIICLNFLTRLSIMVFFIAGQFLGVNESLNKNKLTQGY